MEQVAELAAGAEQAGTDGVVSLAALNSKVDELTAQLAYLTEQARLAERARVERAELMHDLVPIANDAFRLSVEQLEEIQEYVDLGDLLRLLKRVLRNGKNLEKMLDQVESLMDLAATLGPLSDEAFGKAVDMLQTMEHKGYFTFAQGGARIIDNVVTSFGEEDVRTLSDNVVLILNVVKSLTQPKIMTFVDNTMNVVDRELEKPVDASYRALLRDLRDPDARRGLALTLRVMKTIGQQPTNHKS